MTATPLRFTSCMAPNMESMCREIVALPAARLGVGAEFVGEIPWQERERRFAAGEIDVVWICGLPYIWNCGCAPHAVRLLAAPVMRAQRYGGQAVYFSDVVVRRDEPFQSFSDLRGKRFAYNEPRSHSGYNVVRHHLARLGEYEGFFAAAIESGAHQTSLKWIVERRVDASAIDSTVLELELERDPDLARHVVAIGALGPSPMPPWIVRSELPGALRQRLQVMLISLHEDATGRRILDACGVARFVAVDDSHYDPIRRMSAEAAGVRL